MLFFKTIEIIMKSHQNLDLILARVDAFSFVSHSMIGQAEDRENLNSSIEGTWRLSRNQIYCDESMVDLSSHGARSEVDHVLIFSEGKYTEGQREREKCGVYSCDSEVITVEFLRRGSQALSYIWIDSRLGLEMESWRIECQCLGM